MTRSRVVKVDRDGHFQINGHPFTLQKSQHVLTEGTWEVWDEAPDMTVFYVRLASPWAGPGRPVAVAPTYKAARDLIDRAAARGGFALTGQGSRET